MRPDEYAKRQKVLTAPSFEEIVKSEYFSRPIRCAAYCSISDKDRDSSEMLDSSRKDRNSRILLTEPDIVPGARPRTFRWPSKACKGILVVIGERS